MAHETDAMAGCAPAGHVSSSRTVYKVRLGRVRVWIEAWVCGALAVHPWGHTLHWWHVTHRKTGYFVTEVPPEEARARLAELARLPWPDRESELLPYERSLPIALWDSARYRPIDELRRVVDAILEGKTDDEC